MKNLFTAILIALLFPVVASAQKKAAFEGVVTYSLFFEKAGLPPEIMDMLKGSQSVVYIKGGKRRVDLNTNIQSSSTFVDDKKKSVATSMELGDKKYLIKMTNEEMKSEEKMKPETSIQYIDSTKIIAGYTCKKALVTVKNQDGVNETMAVYYTKEIPADKLKEVYKGLKGFPLEYTVLQSGMKMTYIAKSISKEPVPDSKLELPKEGYIETTMDELKKTMGQ